MGVQACRLPSLKRLKPCKTLKTLTTHHGGPSLPFAMLHPAANRHPKATHQWLLMGVQACRLPALKRLKTLQTLKTLTTRHGGPSLPFAMLHPAANRHPKATHQWLLMGVQACRLPAFTQFKRYPKAKSIASSRRSSLPFTTFLFHNAVLDRKLLPTDGSMVYLPCLHVTGHIPFASGANVNIRFLLHNAVLDRKLVPTDRSMV